MPCRCDYMEPNERELESINVAERIKYLHATGIVPISNSYEIKFLDNVINSFYGSVDHLDTMTEWLCEALKELDNANDGYANQIIYDGKNPEARKLADWWQKHQAADLKREQQEALYEKRQVLAKAARAKLTNEELEALGLK